MRAGLLRDQITIIWPGEIGPDGVAVDGQTATVPAGLDTPKLRDVAAGTAGVVAVAELVATIRYRDLPSTVAVDAMGRRYEVVAIEHDRRRTMTKLALKAR